MRIRLGLVHRLLFGLAILGFSFFLSACSPLIVHNVFDNLYLTAGSVHTAESTNPLELPVAPQSYSLPDSYVYENSTRSTDALLRKTGNGGFLVIHKGEIVYEGYAYGKNQDSRFLAWSVSKSVTSALVGIAVNAGYIDSVNDPVVKYVPSLSETAYAESSLEDVLEMASGARFDETYSLGTDIFRLQVAIGGDLTKELHKYKISDHETGTFNEYKSIDTQVLAMVLRAATGESVTSLLETWIWGPAGMTSDARWLADRNGLEAAYCCLNATMRDLGKFGLMYLHNGFYNGQQIVPAQWVTDSLDTSKPHLQPGDNPLSDYDWGYGYQWWIPDTQNDYAAVGVFNQFVYINPEADLVIVTGGAALGYLIDDREDEYIAMFRAISDDFL